MVVCVGSGDIAAPVQCSPPQRIDGVLFNLSTHQRYDRAGPASERVLSHSLTQSLTACVRRCR